MQINKIDRTRQRFECFITVSLLIYKYQQLVTNDLDLVKLSQQLYTCNKLHATYTSRTVVMVTQILWARWMEEKQYAATNIVCLHQPST